MRRTPTRPIGLVGLLLLATAVGCTDNGPTQPQPKPPAGNGVEVHAQAHRKDTRPPPMHQPVPLWQDGKIAKKVDAATADLNGYVVLDIGDEWTPYIFSERGSDDEKIVPNPYRKVYLELANGDFPNDWHGERAREDKYLELYGIMPTLSVLQKRFEKVMKLTCWDKLDLSALDGYDGFIVYQSNTRARWIVGHHRWLKAKVEAMEQAQHVNSVDAIKLDKLDDIGRRRVKEYVSLDADVHAIRAVQKEMDCEGYLNGKGHVIAGGMDWATQQALAEFERRNRIYGWGFIGGETLDALRQSPQELARRTVVRVLTERAMHAAGVIEDGSTSKKKDGSPRTFKGADGKQHPIPNLEEELRKAVVSAFGLQTPESTINWLESLGKLARDKRRLVAFKGPTLPEYYDGDMNLSVVIDRGDVWYDFPFDNDGKQRAQPVRHRPKLTIYTSYLGQKIPLARMGTTIGGWRSEDVNGTVMWEYKNSPVGPRVWHDIVAAPVWLPPSSTPADDLLKRNPGGKGQDAYKINYYEMGPSYASAYGLVAAYHLKYRELPDGGIIYGADEGIRTHGTVDYMSVMRRHSHGCHRLFNHLAVRLMSFVLAHRPHKRLGEQQVAYTMPIEKDGYTYNVELKQGGYVFQLNQPVKVNVLEGHIRGQRQTPIDYPIPKYDEDAGAYMMPDGGGPVKVSPNGKLTPYELPKPDGGLDGGVMNTAPDGGVASAKPAPTQESATLTSSAATAH